MSLLSTPGSSWSLPSSRHYTPSSSSGGSATLRSKPPRSSTLTSSSYFSSSSSIDFPSRRSRMFLGREDALERSEPVKLMSYRDLSESRLPITRADSLSRGIRRLSVTDLTTLTSATTGLDINGNVKKGHERSLSGCSQISGEALAPSPTGSDSGLGSRSITPSSSYHYRTLGSSNSSVDSIEVAVRPLTRHRIRRVSTASGVSSLLRSFYPLRAICPGVANANAQNSFVEALLDRPIDPSTEASTCTGSPTLAFRLCSSLPADV